MYLKSLSLLNFRICSEQTFNFHEGLNCFIGNNGSGKTNILDAIHYLSLCKSYINAIDSHQIKDGEDFFMIQGGFLKDYREENVICTVRKNAKKQFKRNKKEYDRLSEHIGLFPVVMISPYDTNLIHEGSEERRKFIDNTLSQTDASYLEMLIQYNRILLNRNALLKQSGSGRNLDEVLLDILDEQLIKLGKPLYEKRKAFFEFFMPLFQKYYFNLTSGSETVQLFYKSPLEEMPFETGLKLSREKDTIMERTHFGIHKDDIEFYLKELPLKRSGSQGQQKSFLIALKLAHYEFIYLQLGIKPILLLDDIFDKLDEIRVEKLINMVVKDEFEKIFGQVFVTDTQKDNIFKIFKQLNASFQYFEIMKGSLYLPEESKKIDLSNKVT